MKFIIISILVFFGGLYLQSKEDKLISTSSITYPLNDSGEILQIEKANEAGRLVLLDDYGTVYLKDSFISEDRFRNICERVLWSSKIITTEETGSFDHYSPGIHFDRSPKINRFMRSSFLYQGKFYRNKFRSKDRKFVKNEFVGFRKPIWESYMWKFIEHEYTHQKRPLIFTEKLCAYFYSKSEPSKKIYDDCIASWEFMPINFQYYEKILPAKKRSHYDEQPYFKHIEFQMPLPFGMPIEASERMVYKNGDYELMGKLLAQSSLPENDDGGRLPIMCIDPDSHAERVDKNDWAVYALLNKNNGDFYQYFFFEKELQYAYPLFIRNWALDYLGGVHICKKSTVGVPLEKKKKTIVSNIKKEFNPAKLILALNEKNRPWRPNPIPENKLNIPQDRCFYEAKPARIFGSACKVWELDIWQRVGYMLKKHPEGIYLVGYGTLLQAEETQTVAEEHAFIQKHGVLITPELYTALEYLRGKQ